MRDPGRPDFTTLLHSKIVSRPCFYNRTHARTVYNVLADHRLSSKFLDQCTQRRTFFVLVRNGQSFRGAGLLSALAHGRVTTIPVDEQKVKLLSTHRARSSIRKGRETPQKSKRMAIARGFCRQETTCGCWRGICMTCMCTRATAFLRVRKLTVFSSNFSRIL